MQPRAWSSPLLVTFIFSIIWDCGWEIMLAEILSPFGVTRAAPRNKELPYSPV